jgi:hypothetical protein
MVQENIIVSLMHLTELFCLIFHLIVRALGSKAVGLLGGQELPGESIGQVSVILSRQDGWRLTPSLLLCGLIPIHCKPPSQNFSLLRLPFFTAIKLKKTHFGQKEIYLKKRIIPSG